MAFLEKFSQDERDLLISLPYRAGLWISHADGAGGGEASMKELDALENIIESKAKGMFESAFVHEVMAETCTRQSDWRQWAVEMESTGRDCKKAIEIISGKLEKRDVDAYRQNIMHIAVSVAKAFREFDLNQPLFSKVGTYIRIGLDRLVGMARHEIYETESLLNISYGEDVALLELSDALGIGAQGQEKSNPASQK